MSTHLPFPINSIAPDRTPGGSSSGSAAAVVGHLCDIAVASDTQGSVRTPGSYCGLIGLRTTHGRIPMDGCFKACPSMDTFGWFAKDLETYEKVAEVLLGPTKKEVKDVNKVKLVTLNEFDEVLMSEEEKEEYHNMRKVLEEVFGAAEIVGPFKVKYKTIKNCLKTCPEIHVLLFLCLSCPDPALPYSSLPSVP